MPVRNASIDEWKSGLIFKRKESVQVSMKNARVGMKISLVAWLQGWQK